MLEITYILGAGASFQSMPVVKTFSSRFKEFITSLKILNSEPHNKFNKDEAKILFQNLDNFFIEIQSHQSFDTYFKKLFHQGLENDILIAKKILNFYFLWEHLQKTTDHKQFNIDQFGNNLTNKAQLNNFNKTASIDKRYDALIAGILQPVKGKCELYAKTNFITWNYDLNLLNSIKNFFSPTQTINGFINDCIYDNPSIWGINKDLQIINMNGFFYSIFLDKIIDLNKSHWDIEFINSLKLSNNFSIEKNFILNDINKIKFAWENKAPLDKSPIIETAIEAIERASVIVVIGYTFPLYNRLIDLKYFNQKTLNHKWLYIQDPDAKNIVETIKSNFKIKTPEELTGQQYTSIYPIENCDSFFVPSNIF